MEINFPEWLNQSTDTKKCYAPYNHSQFKLRFQYSYLFPVYEKEKQDQKRQQMMVEIEKNSDRYSDNDMMSIPSKDSFKEKPEH